jgi:branched-chain amino acid transport system substrate-binding protein
MKLSFVFQVVCLCLLPIIPLVSRADDAVGVTADKVVFGSGLSVTGPTGLKALQVQKGSDIVFKKVNASGGIEGRKIEVKYVDTGNDPKVALEVTKKFFTEDKVFAMFEYFGIGAVRTCYPFIEKEHTPLIAPIAGDDYLRSPFKKYLFPVGATTKDELGALTKFATEKLGLKKFGILYPDASYGLASRLAVLSRLHDHGLKIEGEGLYKEDKAMNLEPALEKLMKSNVDAVFIAAQIEEAARFIKMAHEKNFNPVFLGTAPMASGKTVTLLSGLDAKVYVTMRFPLISSKDSQLVQMYLKDAQAVGEKPDPAQIEGYVGAQVLVEALRRAGKNLTRERLVSALETMTDFRVGEIQISYSPTVHQGSASVFLAKVTKDGFVTEAY